MKRVLLVAYCFPPEPLPGALRPGYIARYAPEFGWEATVLTHSSGEAPFPARVVRVGGSAAGASGGAAGALRRSPRTAALRAVLRKVKEFLAFPDEEAPWIPLAVLRGLQLMREEHYDAILTTALPVSAHVVGACLSALTGTPWIADYRDAWSQNPYMPWSAVRRRLHRALELAVVGRAAHLTTVSSEIAQQLQTLHGRPVSSIENAYDAAEWDSVPQAQPTGFDLVYTGTMYGGKRSARVLFEALSDLAAQGHEAGAQARVHFYGPNNDAVLAEAREFGIERQVFVHGHVPRAQAMLEQRRAAGLLIFLNTDPATARERGSKYLEYAGARRGMLVFGPERSVLREIVERARLGWFASDADEAKRAILALYARYSAGDYAFSPDDAYLPTSVELARTFVRALDDIAKHDSIAAAASQGEPRCP